MVLQSQLCRDDKRALRQLGCDLRSPNHPYRLLECQECLEEFCSELPNQRVCAGCLKAEAGAK